MHASPTPLCHRHDYHCHHDHHAHHDHHDHHDEDDQDDHDEHDEHDERQRPLPRPLKEVQRRENHNLFKKNVPEK